MQTDFAQMTEHHRDFIPFLCACGIVAILVELILSARWSSCYFAAGIPIYKRIIKVQSGIVRMPIAGEVEAALPDSGRSAPMIIRRIGENRFAFREKLFHFGIAYSPLMHGCIMYNAAAGEIKVHGYLNWYILLFSCYFLFFLMLLPFDPINVLIPFCLLVLISNIYWLQMKRYRQVGDAVRNLWSEGDPRQ
jgi:hypothetical protein